MNSEPRSKKLNFISLAIPVLILGGLLVGLGGSILDGWIESGEGVGSISRIESIGLLLFWTGILLMPIFAFFTFPKEEPESE